MTANETTSADDGRTPSADDEPPAAPPDDRQPVNRPDDPANGTDGEFDAAPSSAERGVDPSVAAALHDAYGIGHMGNQGATAIGTGSAAIHVSQAIPEPIRVNRIANTVLDAERRRYVPTRRDRWIDRVLRSRHLVYLSGIPGTGRGMAARAALHRARPGSAVDEVHLEPEGTLVDLLQSDRIRGDDAIVVRCPVGSVDADQLGSLARAAASRGWYVLVIGEPDESDRMFTHYRVEHAPADPVDIFRQNLRCAAPRATADEMITLCLSDESFRRRVGLFRRTAEVLALVERVVEQHPQSAEQLPSLWYDSESSSPRHVAEELMGLGASVGRGAQNAGRPDPRMTYLRCFRIAYALMNGCRIGLVADTEKPLRALMQLPEPGAADHLSPRRSWDGFGLSLDELVPVKLGLTGDAVQTASGRLARLSDDRLLPALLDVAWNDFPDSQELLLDWLRALVDDLDDEVIRQRAAVAATIFALFDYDRVFVRLLNDWASSARARKRQVAALALALLAGNTDMVPRIRDRVYRWVHGPFARLRDTALRAYDAGFVSTVSTSRVMDDLGVIAGQDSHRDSPVIAMVVDRATDLGSIAVVMAALQNWQQRDSASAVHAFRSVLRLSGTRDPDSVRTWPIALRWVHRDADRRAEFVRTLGPALAHRKTAYDGWSCIGNWLSNADGDDDLAETVLAVLADLSTVDVLRERMSFHVRHAWRTTMPGNPVLHRVIELTGVAA